MHTLHKQISPPSLIMNQKLAEFHRMNSWGSRVKKNTQAQKVQMQKISSQTRLWW